MPDESPNRSGFDISWRALAKIVITLVLVWMWLKLWQLALVLLISVLIAVAIDPVVCWLEQRRVPRWLGSAGCILLLAGAVAALVVAGWSSLQQQGRLIAQSLTDIYHQMKASFPVMDSLMPAGNRLAPLEQYVTAFASSAMRALMLVTIGLILTVYLLIEWKRTVEWLIAFIPKVHRPRVRQTLSEARKIVFGYVTGNVATSIFATIFVFVALTLLKVPAALLLALLAGVFDFVPVLGFALSGVPAVALATTVSSATAVLVLGLYAMYHFIENYFIGPKVYGAELKLSNLAVLISFAVGAELGGVIGALLALPIAATYPAIERIWLSDRLESDTVEKHQRLEQVKTSA